MYVFIYIYIYIYISIYIYIYIFFFFGGGGLVNTPGQEIIPRFPVIQRGIAVIVNAGG